MAKMLMIKPASGDSSASLFSDANSSSAILDNVPTGTLLKVTGTSGNFYTVEYDSGMPNVFHGGTEMTGTVVAYPSAPMYSDISKTTIIGKVNNGTTCEILNDLHPTMIEIEAVTTEGNLSGFVEVKFIHCDNADEPEVAMFNMRRSAGYLESLDDFANSVIRGEWGNGTARKNNITEAYNSGDIPYTYDQIQTRVNEIMRGSSIPSGSGQTGTVITQHDPLITHSSAPGNKSTHVGHVYKDSKVTVHETKSGWYRITGTKGDGDYTNVWVSATYIRIDGTETEANASKSDGVEVDNDSSNEPTTADGENWMDYIATTSTATYSAGDEYYRKLADKYAFALGSPPKYNKDIDIRYDENITNGDNCITGTGRVFNKTLLSTPAILSICPGSVKMFPNLFGTERASAFDALKEVAKGNQKLLDKINGNDPSRFSGRLYQFKAETAEYAKYLNILCRAAAIMLGIGDELMPNTTSKLKNFDYAYWTVRKSYNPSAAAAADDDKSIWRKFYDALVKTYNQISGAVAEDTTYINFFLNGTETSITEQMNTGTENSPLQGLMEQISDIGSKINYFTQSGFDSSDEELLDAINSIFGTDGGVFDGLSSMANNFLNGGRMVLPRMVTGSQYDRSISCNMKFVSPYGHKYAVFLNCIVPICHILAMSLPRQLSDNMYTYPFLVKCNQLGNFHCDLGVITNVTINRGGSEEISWSTEMLSTEWDVTIEITPLVNELMITSSTHPWLFCQNEMLLSYLSNFCGFDMLANNLETKIEMMKRFTDNVILDLPHSIDNKITDNLHNLLYRIFELSW